MLRESPQPRKPNRHMDDILYASLTIVKGMPKCFCDPAPIQALYAPVVNPDFESIQ